ncbi:PAS domain-containing protein [Paenibacillus glucanolyticus]|uniref:ATP-binding protein n=1 Tax=Paenibacillus TaxID=44249 RepID=UPI0003E1EC15|nr:MULTISPECIES: ATP-binding protein [Paenibacillus]ANA82721.1 PAS domain-containing sensor histidine kinase [Paenibacillus glucanolyticus]AVV58196.1 PAS domain-containing protein [Paenibacillus glucanolyticus]ETT42953.1 PAS/PAC sensor signal transduction histidine kinase [Paenibacillus sp. FSL R5-808]
MLPYPNQNPDFAFEQAVIGMAIVSLDGTLLKANTALSDLLGYTQQALTAGAQQAESIRMLLNCIVQNVKASQDHQQSINPFEHTYHHPEKHKLYLNIHTGIELDTEKNPKSYWVQLEDRTLHRQLMEQLEQKEQKLIERKHTFLQLLEILPLSVLITKKGIVQYVNPAALKMVKATHPRDVLGISTDVVVDVSSHNDLIKRRMRYEKDGVIGSVNYLIRCLDGQEKIVSGCTIMVHYEGDTAALGIFKDITEQRMEEDRVMQSEKLTTAGQLAAGIAHEIRNPLTSINGFVKLLRSSESSNELYFEIIESELKRIELIVNELLVLSKPQGVHASGPIEVLPILEQIITLMKVQAALKNIEIIPHYPDVPISVQGEVNQLKQVFINLLKNAMEAMNQGGTITVDILLSGHNVQIVVQDEGIGMTPEQIQSLGQPFFTTKDTGTGLGLMITKNIIHNHGGTMNVESVPDHGTTFTIQLPAL